MSLVPVPATTRRPVAHGVDGGGEELQLLGVAQRRALTGRAGDDEPVGAVLDEVDGQLAELLDVHGAVRMERRHDRGQHLTAARRRSLRALQAAQLVDGDVAAR